MAEEAVDQGTTPEESANLEAPDTSTQTTADDAGADKPTGVQKRINELTRNWRETERERDYWRQLAESTAQKPANAPQVPKQRPQRPTEEQFGYDQAKYNEAVTKYEEDLVEWKLSQRETAREKQERERREAEEQQRRAQTFAEKRDKTVSEGAEKFADFEEVVYSLPGNVMTEQVAEAVFETSNPADVAYYLGKNPREAAEIAQMGAVQRAIRLGAIDAKLGIAAQKRSTSAPPPPPKGEGGGGAPIDINTLARTNPKEFARLRNEGKI